MWRARTQGSRERQRLCRWCKHSPGQSGGSAGGYRECVRAGECLNGLRVRSLFLLPLPPPRPASYPPWRVLFLLSAANRAACARSPRLPQGSCLSLRLLLLALPPPASRHQLLAPTPPPRILPPSTLRPSPPSAALPHCPTAHPAAPAAAARPAALALLLLARTRSPPSPGLRAHASNSSLLRPASGGRELRTRAHPRTTHDACGHVRGTCLAGDCGLRGKRSIADWGTSGDAGGDAERSYGQTEERGRSGYALGVPAGAKEERTQERICVDRARTRRRQELVYRGRVEIPRSIECRPSCGDACTYNVSALLHL
ncbi:hypothetical protein C8R44DRAFT_892578 [Mycena epipterygia]|nr:hypothetical protein C8R44DRAFT_892578 [Mycena epipterygia]